MFVSVCSSGGVYVQPSQQIVWGATQKTRSPECHHRIHCSFRIHGRFQCFIDIDPVKEKKYGKVLFSEQTKFGKYLPNFINCHICVNCTEICVCDCGGVSLSTLS